MPTILKMDELVVKIGTKFWDLFVGHQQQVPGDVCALLWVASLVSKLIAFHPTASHIISSACFRSVSCQGREQERDEEKARGGERMHLVARGGALAMTRRRALHRPSIQLLYSDNHLSTFSVNFASSRCQSSSRFSSTSGLGGSSGRWSEQWSDGEDAHSFLLQEEFGDYFKVPNPNGLMTKIVCTVGPSTSSKEKLGEMLDAGMSCVRLNASHGDTDFFAQAIANVRSAAEDRRRICPIMLDTKGPEIRVQREVAGGEVELVSGAPFTFFKEPQPGGGNPQLGVSTTYPRIATTVEEGDVILVDDGRLSFLVRQIDLVSGDVLCAVIAGGTLKGNKGVNIPGCVIDLPHLTDKDKRDIAFAVEHNIEYIAHSFTRSAAGIVAVREIPGVVEKGIHVIAKIENQESLENLGNIIRVSDGIMVARGDLGVEIPLERVCSVQKKIIRECNRQGKFVITATEMLDSMINNPRPTRAESNDVANAVFDGTDCVMLSGETAVGKYPVATIQVMNRICKEAELDIEHHQRSAMDIGAAVVSASKRGGKHKRRVEVGEAFCMAGVATALEVGATLIVAVTKSGDTARLLSKQYPKMPILALCLSPKVCSQVSLYRGVVPYLVDSLNRASCVPRGIAKATELGLVSQGSRVLLVTGHDDAAANRLETFVVGSDLPELNIIPGGRYNPGSSFQAP